MSITEYLSPEAVLPDMQAQTRDGLLAELAEPLYGPHPELRNFDLVRVLCEREKLGSTAVGEGVAIPHGKVSGLKELALAVGISRKGIDFNAPDGAPCHLFFLILAPDAEAGQHLRLLAQIARRVKDPVFRSELLSAKTRDQLFQALTTP